MDERKEKNIIRVIKNALKDSAKIPIAVKEIKKADMYDLDDAIASGFSTEEAGPLLAIIEEAFNDGRSRSSSGGMSFRLTHMIEDLRKSEYDFGTYFAELISRRCR